MSRDYGDPWLGTCADCGEWIEYKEKDIGKPTFSAYWVHGRTGSQVCERQKSEQF